MTNPALKDILAALNAIRGQLAKADAETKMAALEAMLSGSVAIVAMSKKLVTPEMKVVRKPCSIPKPPAPKRPPPKPQPAKPMKQSEPRRNLKPIRPVPPFFNKPAPTRPG